METANTKRDKAPASELQGCVSVRSAMNKRAALNKAVKLWGAKAAVEDYGKHAATAEQRRVAREEFFAIRETKPEGWREQSRELSGVMNRERYRVGKVQKIGGFGFFEVLGVGDTWEEAFEQAAKKERAS